MKLEFYKHIELDTEAEDIKSILEENDITYEISSADVLIDSAIVGSKKFAKYTLKLAPTDFKQANVLISVFYENQEIHVEDYEHLNELSKDELFDILINPEGWPSEAPAVAKTILKSRNIAVKESYIQSLRDKKDRTKREGKSVSLYIQLLYFLAIVMGIYASPIFTLAGVGMGYHYAYGKTTDSQGTPHFVYDAKARKIGSYILYGGGFILLLQILYIMSLIFI
ncbi:MAG: hypothetical protein AB8F78_19025 [Saprospiraceae bacterium]